MDGDDVQISTDRKLPQVSGLDEVCIICAESLGGELGGALDLPCKCHMAYHHRCWDNCLASTIASTGNATCPTCRSVVRVDYDAQEGRLIYSKVAEARIPYGQGVPWLDTLDEVLGSHGLAHDDEEFKFSVTDCKGMSTKLWARFSCRIRWDFVQANGGRWAQILNRTVEQWNQRHRQQSGMPELMISAEEIAAGPSIKDCAGKEIDCFDVLQTGKELPQECFPILVKYPKQANAVICEPAEHRFPLTVTFKEYVITIDNTVGLPSLREAFCVSSTGQMLVGENNVSLASQWKDQKTGVQLHPGDWIIEVNGMRGAAEELLEQLDKKELLLIRVQQSASLTAATHITDPNNATRERLARQTKPRQYALLREFGANAAPGETKDLRCVCGGALELLNLRSRVLRLVEPQDESGVLRHAGRSLTVDQLIDIGAVTCDLCDERISVHGQVWSCENGSNTILHAQSLDICENCLKTATGERARDRELIKQQELEYQESLHVDTEHALELQRREEHLRDHAVALQQRREKFENEYPLPHGIDPRVVVRFRSMDGSDVERCFTSTALVSALFEFVAIADWTHPPPSEFDLQTSHPKRSLGDAFTKSRTLQDVGLDACVLLRIVAL